MSTEQTVALVVCQHARNTDDARLLLEALGLLGESGLQALTHTYVDSIRDGDPKGTFYRR